MFCHRHQTVSDVFKEINKVKVITTFKAFTNTVGVGRGVNFLLVDHLLLKLVGGGGDGAFEMFSLMVAMVGVHDLRETKKQRKKWK